MQTFFLTKALLFRLNFDRVLSAELLARCKIIEQYFAAVRPPNEDKSEDMDLFPRKQSEERLLKVNKDEAPRFPFASLYFRRLTASMILVSLIGI